MYISITEDFYGFTISKLLYLSDVIYVQPQLIAESFKFIDPVNELLLINRRSSKVALF